MRPIRKSLRQLRYYKNVYVAAALPTPLQTMKKPSKAADGVSTPLDTPAETADGLPVVSVYGHDSAVRQRCLVARARMIRTSPFVGIRT